VIKFTLGGIPVTQAKFKQLPSFLAARAQAALVSLGTSVAADIAGAYAALGGTGQLAAGMVVRSTPQKNKARVVIANRVRWSAGYEFGTKDRWTKKHKKKAYRGYIARTSGGRIFVPRVMKARETIIPKVAAIMRAEGLTVTGG
jgi:hypothetical protein